MDEVIHCCKLTDASGNPELTQEFIAAQDVAFSSWSDDESGQTQYTIYCADEGEAEEVASGLRALIPDWKRVGLSINNIQTVELAKEEWSEVWKKFFDIIHLSPRLVIRPSWLAYEPTPGQVVVDIDPGMSFGTGRHATTSYCLRIMDKLAGSSPDCSLLDAGSGSGILSIAAAKLGYAPIDAFDNDPLAVKVAMENFAINRLPVNAVNISTADVAAYRSSRDGYHLVAANILGVVLEQHLSRLVSFVRASGYLILAGTLQAEFSRLASRLQREYGMELVDSQNENEWTSGLFHKQGQV